LKSLPKNLKPGEIIYVVWNDAFHKAWGWTSIVSVLKDGPMRCYSVGFYLGQNKAGDVLISSSYDVINPTDNAAINGVLGRPLAMIQSITKIKGKFPK
jgi:hypothetical protein